MESRRLLTKTQLERVTGGTFNDACPESLSVAGVCTWLPVFQPGDLVVHRGQRPQGFLNNESVIQTLDQGAAVVMTEDVSSLKTGPHAPPILHVKNVRYAVQAIGRFVRNQFRGQVVGVTGTAGKTSTVGLITEVLRAYGVSCGTTASANLPTGIAWTMTKLPRNADFWTLEMAIGQMPKNSALVKPHIAVVTNVGAAHLEYHGSVENVANKKAEIFSAMQPGGVAVINADMAYADCFLEKAKSKDLRIIRYGSSRKADIRLMKYNDGAVEAKLAGQRLRFRLAAQGLHFATNALATLGVVHALGLDTDAAIAGLERFVPVGGRGEEIHLPWQGGQLTLRNDAYNANPVSMAAAIGAVQQTTIDPAYKVVVLGDMLELGTESDVAHEKLFDHLKDLEIDRLLLCGDQMKVLWTVMRTNQPNSIRVCEWVPDVEAVKVVLASWLQSGDYLMVKGSNSTRLHTLAQWLRKASEVGS